MTDGDLNATFAKERQISNPDVYHLQGVVIVWPVLNKKLDKLKFKKIEH